MPCNSLPRHAKPQPATTTGSFGSTKARQCSPRPSRGPGPAAQLLQSTVEHQVSASCPQLLATDSAASSSVATSQTTEPPQNPASAFNTYANLFDPPDHVVSDALCWANANAMHPQVASCLEACSQWDSAIAAGEHKIQKKRRRLCKDHDIPYTKVVETNAKLDAAMEYIRRELTNRIHQIRPTRKSIQLLLQSKAEESPSGQYMQQPTILRMPHFTYHARKRKKLMPTSWTITLHTRPLALHLQR